MASRGAGRRETGIDVLEHRDADALVAAARERGIELSPDETWPQLVDELLSKHVEPKLVNPAFVVDHPVELSSLAKVHRSKPGLVERFQCFAALWSSRTRSAR